MELLGVLTDDEDVLELIEILEPHRNQRVYQERVDHLQKWNEEEFIRRFRLSKNGVRYVLEQIIDKIACAIQRNHAVSPIDMLLVTLRFYTIGSFLQVIGDFIVIDKSTASRIVNKVGKAIAGLRQDYIKMPLNQNEIKRCSQEFYNICRFPKCVSAVDCTHIKIQSPGGEEPEVYRNRKGFFSLNVQVVGAANCTIQDIVCRWPGSSHDSTIFNNSTIRTRFENGEFAPYVLVGDSGYGIRPFLITPLGNPRTAAEHLFNEAQVRTRNPIERLFGIWKRRFPILAMGIRVKQCRVETIIVATSVLHNIAFLFKDALPPLAAEVEAEIELGNNVPAENARVVGGRNNITRHHLINEYFGGLLQ